MTGHSQGATGAQEAIYCLLMLRDDFIAASINVETLDPASEPARSPRRVDDAGLDTVMTNSFGFGGTNASLLFSAAITGGSLTRFGRQLARRRRPRAPSPADAGKRALILGVANDHSIAWGIARAFAAARRRARLHLPGRGVRPRVIPLAESLGAKIVVPADVQDAASLDALFARIAADWGRLDVLVHAIAFSDKAELDGPLPRHQPGELPELARHLLLQPRRAHPARRAADAGAAARS